MGGHAVMWVKGHKMQTCRHSHIEKRESSTLFNDVRGKKAVSVGSVRGEKKVVVNVRERREDRCCCWREKERRSNYILLNSCRRTAPMINLIPELDGVPIKTTISVNVHEEALNGTITIEQYDILEETIYKVISGEFFRGSPRPTWMLLLNLLLVHSEGCADPIRVPSGPITRARAKKIKEALMTMVQEIMSKAEAWRSIEGDRVQEWKTLLKGPIEDVQNSSPRD
ncbi:hypothetical protein LguiB_031911 [Lonicera macranthoides]